MKVTKKSLASMLGVPMVTVYQYGSKQLFRVNGFIYSYRTIVGKQGTNGIWYILKRGESVTTSKHCNYVARQLSKVERVDSLSDIELLREF